MVGQPGLSDVEDRLKRLSGLGDQLEAFSAAVGIEMFRPTLNEALACSDGTKGGRRPLDPATQAFTSTRAYDPGFGNFCIGHQRAVLIL